jgi:hypothetical protein
LVGKWEKLLNRRFAHIFFRYYWVAVCTGGKLSPGVVDTGGIFFTAGVVDTGGILYRRRRCHRGIFTACVVDSWGIFTAAVVDTGGIFTAASLTPEAYLPPASLTPVANFAAGVTAINVNLEKDVIAGVSDTAGKFAVDVKDPSVRFSLQWCQRRQRGTRGRWFMKETWIKNLVKAG